jgi:5-methyltetrahydrofolate--homocysteine methyltransferase
MVGGAPVTDSFAQQIGADGYAPDAPSAAALARRLAGSPAQRADSA